MTAAVIPEPQVVVICLFHIHAFCGEDVAEFFGRLQAASFDQFSEGDACSSGHMAGTYAEPGLR